MLRRPNRSARLTIAAATGASAAVAQAQSQRATDAGVPVMMPRDDSALRTELRQQQDLVMLLRQRLANAEQASTLVPWLLAGLLVTLGLLAWLAWRVKRQAPARPARPARESAPASAFGHREAEDSAGPATVFAPGLMQQESSVALDQVSTSTMGRRVAADAGSMVLGGAGSLAMASAGLAPAISPRSATPAAAAAEPPGVPREPERATAAAPASGAAPTPAPAPAVGTGPARAQLDAAEPPMRASEVTLASHLPRAVSVEELFDLEQQVDFFLVLGQTESAVDLLVSHIRGTGGNSALPYLKLMEVYRQQGDVESYERTRKRFNQRFNAHAPDAAGDPKQGRSLDEYPEVMERLLAAWPMPLDALAELEAMLFRRSRGELFDLPAFRDVLLLHAMAIDLHERSPMSARRVDILLPLGEELSDNTAPLPHVVPAAGEGSSQLLASWAGLGNGPAAVADPVVAPGDFRPARVARPAEPTDTFSLDLDLSDFAPAPKEYTHPAAFTDLAMRADFSPMPLAAAAANDLPGHSGKSGKPFGPAAPAR